MMNIFIVRQIDNSFFVGVSSSAQTLGSHCIGVCLPHEQMLPSDWLAVDLELR